MAARNEFIYLREAHSSSEEAEKAGVSVGFCCLNGVVFMDPEALFLVCFGLFPFWKNHTSSCTFF